MFRHLSITAAALVISLTGAAVDYTDSISPTVDTHQSVGLVLSGGGAKGIAHIGVIQALEDNDIPIDYITGTSMGAIVGSLYAIGYTPDEMMQLLLSPEFADWSTGRINENLVYYFAKKEPSPEMFSFPLSLGDSASVTQFPASLVSPLPMNFAFMDLYAAYTAQCGGDFDKLFVPFRCIASDITNKHKVVCRGGQLGDAVRASMSFPVVFQPIEMDSVLLYDGGIYDNFPVDVMRSEFAPSIMIGVDVHGTTDPAKARELVNQIEEMVIQNNDYDLPADQGIKIRLHLDNFSLLDFPAARQIYDIGYNRTIEMMDSIKSRITSRIPASTRQLQRNVFKSATPGLRFDKIEVNGGTKQEDDYIRYLFTKNRPDTFGIKSARLSYYHAITPGKLADLFPTAIYNPSSQLFKLKLRADVKNNLTVGIGGYLTSSANSMLYLNSRYTSMSLKSMDASLGGWLGQSYLAAALNTRLILPSHTPTALSLQAVVSRRQYHENDKLFFDNSAPSFVTAIEAFGRLRYTVAAGRSAKATIDVGGGTHISRFYNSEAVNFSNAMRDNTKFNIAQARMLFEASTLDNLTAPTAGYFANVTAEWNTGKYHFQPGTPNAHKRSSSTNWLQAQAKLRYFGRISDHFSLGGELNALYSNRKLLDNYNASIVNAPAFTPTPVADNSFNPAFRANAFAAIGVVPVWIINDNLQLRGNFHMFRPIRRITADDNTTQSNFAHLNHDLFAYCELSAAYTFRSVTLSAYGNFQSYPHDNWNVGMSFGIYFLAPTLN